MTYWEAFLFGLVEGITEYLPVSSTGHLLLTTQLLGHEQTRGQQAFEIAIQGGAILAVIGAYRRGVVELWKGLLGTSENGRALLIRLLIAFAITGVLGLAFNKRIKEHFFNLHVVAAAWIVGGVAIFAVEAWRQKRTTGNSLDKLTINGAVMIGLMQAVALCPGVSRSLVTLVGGLLVGLSFTAALEFSFLLGGVTLLAASGYEGVKHFEDIRRSIDLGPAIVAFLTATVSAWMCVRWMLRSLERFGLRPFGWYRILLGIAVLGLLAAQVIQPK